MAVDFADIQRAFQAVAALPPGQRKPALEEACGTDAELRRQVQALLRAHDDSGELPAARHGPTGPYVPAVEADQVFAGRYKLREKLGEGGMGTVFVADQTEPVARRVALKIIRHGADSARVLARFEQERQALALMDHPNIAKVFDAGADEAGRPFFSMELVKGLPLTRYCDEAKLTPRQRLELFVPVCQAVQHAHQKGVIHRDLKPSNILVGLYDGRPVPKVIDFGVAKATGPRLTDQSIYTEVGSLIGTLEYMSPEQAELNNLDIDTRSDVYALGVILYELLTGSVPFSRQELAQAGFAEMLRLIKESEPVKPSTRLSGSGTLPSIAAARHTEPKRLTALVRGELDWIVMKALEKERGRRYETATGLATDVQRYLAGEAVQAAPAGAGYRLRKFVRRNRGPMVAASLVAAALLAGIVGTTWGMFRAERAADREAQERGKADVARKDAQAKEAEANAVVAFFLQNVFAAAGPKGVGGGLGKEVTLKQAVDACLPKLDSGFKDQPLVEARLRRALGATLEFLGERTRAVEQLERARTLCVRHRGPDHRDTLQCLNSLGLCYSGLGRTQAALTLFEEILAIQKRTLPPDDPDALMTQSNIAMCHGKLGQIEEALRGFQEVLVACKRALPPNAELTLSTMNNLGTCYANLGRHEEACKLREELLAINKVVFPPGDIKIFYTMAELALSYNRLGRYDEAVELLEKSVAAHQAVFPANHPNTLAVLEDLAMCYGDVRRPKDQQRLLEDVLKARKAVLPANDSRTLRTMLNLATCYEKLNRHSEALALRVDTLSGMRKAYPVGHPRTLMSMYNLANSYVILNRHAEALPLLKEALGQANLSRVDPQAVPKTIDKAMLCCQKLGDGAEWRALAAVLEKQAPSAVNLYNVACCWSCAAALPEKAASADSSGLATREADRAMVWLTKAIAAGYNDAAHIKRDTDLDPIRQREDFKKLLAALEQKNLAKPASKKE